jgi:[acyl-carrier-protein] S-malonyltransferase
MRPAAEQLRARLATSVFTAPQCRFISSVDATEYRDPEAIRDLLYRQLASPVRWVATVQALVGLGVTRFVECGPGKVLAGLHRRIDKTPGVEATALEDPASLSSALAGGAA